MIREILSKEDLTAKELAHRLKVSISCIYRYLDTMGAKKVFKLP